MKQKRNRTGEIALSFRIAFCCLILLSGLPSCGDGDEAPAPAPDLLIKHASMANNTFGLHDQGPLIEFDEDRPPMLAVNLEVENLGAAMLPATFVEYTATLNCGQGEHPLRCAIPNASGRIVDFGDSEHLTRLLSNQVKGETVFLYLREAAYEELAATTDDTTCDLKLVADPNNHVEEIDEHNNEYMLSVIFVPDAPRPAENLGAADWRTAYDFAVHDLLPPIQRWGPTEPGSAINVGSDMLPNRLKYKMREIGGYDVPWGIDFTSQAVCDLDIDKTVEGVNVKKNIIILDWSAVAKIDIDDVIGYDPGNCPPDNKVHLSLTSFGIDVFGPILVADTCKVNVTRSFNKPLFEQTFPIAQWNLIEFYVPMTIGIDGKARIAIKGSYALTNELGPKKLSAFVKAGPGLDLDAIGSVALDVHVAEGGAKGILKIVNTYPRVEPTLSISNYNPADLTGDILATLDIAFPWWVATLDGRMDFFVRIPWVYEWNYNLINWEGIQHEWLLYSHTFEKSLY